MFIPCALKQLPMDLWATAAQIAVDENPANHPPLEQMAAFSPTLEPNHIAVLTSKYWKTAGVKLGVTFMEDTPQDLKNRIILHANAWGKTANIVFSESANGEVRISRMYEGYWSYLGTDILSIPKYEPTMNLQDFTMQTPDSEFYRVVRHEVGHTLGAPHEHMRKEIVERIDPQKAIDYFAATQGWSARDVMQQVLTPLRESDLTATPHADQTSIMAYQLPPSITRDGLPITGGTDINDKDYAFVAKLWPKATTPPVAAGKRKIVLNFDSPPPKFTVTQQ